MQQGIVTLFSLIVVGGLTALTLSGCGTSGQDRPSPEAGPGTQSEAQPRDSSTGDDSTSPATSAPASDPTSDSAGEAVLSYGDTTYTSELKFCSLSADEDALFHGVANDESGDSVGYLDGDFGGLSDDAYGEVRINFGATGKFESTDNFVAMGDAENDIVITDSSETSLVVVGGAWAEDGTNLPTATLRVTC